jgi:alpha-L-fucosidase
LSSLSTFDGKTKIKYHQLDNDVLVVQLPEGLRQADDLILKLSIK